MSTSAIVVSHRRGSSPSIASTDEQQPLLEQEAEDEFKKTSWSPSKIWSYLLITTLVVLLVVFIIKFIADSADVDVSTDTSSYHEKVLNILEV